MRIDVVTVFPEMVETVGRFGVTGRARERGRVELVCWNPRDFSHDRHRTVDDRPYGGGPGMVMTPAPISAAIAAALSAHERRVKVIYTSPAGRLLDDAGSRRLAEEPGLVILAGRYEGVDQRALDALVDEEWSIGDYVLSGGELAAMVMIDALTRHLPGVLGNEESASRDAFAAGMLGWPQYTRPESFSGADVPPVLLGGDHEAIRRWRLKQALGRTWMRRPDLLRKVILTTEMQELLCEFQDEQENEDRAT